MVEKEQQLIARVLDRVSGTFGKRAVLRGGMVLRILGSPRLTNDLDTISRVLSQNVTDLFGGLLSLVGILVMMFAINFWLALGSMIVFPLMMWCWPIKALLADRRDPIR